MRSAGLARGLALFLVGAGALGALGWLWWSSTRAVGISFLPHQAPGKWIVYPSAADLVLRPRLELVTEFKRSFTLAAAPRQATLRVAAFGQYSIRVNGRVLGEPQRTGRSWKQPSEFEAGKQLRVGENELEVRVLNSSGPPALWLALEAGQVKVVSDESWLCSYAEAAWCPARLAREPKLLPAGSPMLPGESPSSSLRGNWVLLLLFAALAAALCRALDLWRPREEATSEPQGAARHAQDPSPARRRLKSALDWLRRRDLLAAGGLAAFWIALFANNIRGLPDGVGYDAGGHMEYIQYVATHHSLPLPGQGWEMYQPPLYYVLSAALMQGLGTGLNADASRAALRLLGLGIGVAHFVIILGILRILFPARPSTQRVGLLLAACLPMLLFISQYISNEGLAAALVSASVCLALRMLNQPQASWRAYAGLGACLGVALLAKSSALLAVPVIIGGIAWKGVFGGQSPKPEPQSPASEARHSQSAVQSMELQGGGCGGAMHWGAGAAVAVAVCLAVCGWHYARVWANYGAPLLGNWGPEAGFNWWQDDGYRTSAYYFKFGEVLRRPWYASLQSFGDGIYSTLWGDGMLGGSSELPTRPPWNYGLMAMGYWLALVPSAMVAAGGALMTLGFIRRPSAQGFMVLGLGFLVGLALVHMSLAIPCFGMAKAFYGLAATAPLCAAGAAGFEAITRRSKLVRVLLSTLLGLWAINSCASFWVLPSSAQARIGRSRSLAIEGRLPEELGLLKGLVADEPQNLDARSLLIASLLANGEAEEAVRQAEALARGNPAHARAQLALSAVASLQGRMGAAVQHARRALELAPGDASAYEQLAVSLAGAGRYSETAEVARQGLGIAPFSSALRLALGCALLAAGDTNSAAQFALVARLGPASAQLHLMVGGALAQAGRMEEAAAELRRALGGEVSGSELHTQLGTVLVDHGKFGEAIAQFYKALRANPDSPDALNSLAWIRAANPNSQFRDGAEAVGLAERACQLTAHRQPMPLTTLAAAYAEAGRFDEAVSAASQARALALGQGQTGLAERNQKLIELFTLQKPFRDPDAAP